MNWNVKEELAKTMEYVIRESVKIHIFGGDPLVYQNSNINGIELNFQPLMDRILSIENSLELIRLYLGEDYKEFLQTHNTLNGVDTLNHGR